MTGSFPMDKVKKLQNSTNEYNYQANIFKKGGNLMFSRSFSQTETSIIDDNAMRTPVKTNENQLILKNSLSKKISEDNIDLITNDEFNTLEKRKIASFDFNYAFSNNNNNISKMDDSKSYNTEPQYNIDFYNNYNTYKGDDIFKTPLNNSLNASAIKDNNNPKDTTFLSFIETSKSFKNTKNKEEFNTFREKSTNELKDIKSQMKALESNLNSILDKLNQQISSSKTSLSQSITSHDDQGNSNQKNKESLVYNENNSKLVEKKVIILQKNKESLKSCESPLKARVDPDTKDISKNMSKFCRNLVEETQKGVKNINNNSFNYKDEFAALNTFKAYEQVNLENNSSKTQENPKKMSFTQNNLNFNIQNHFEMITKDVMNSNDNNINDISAKKNKNWTFETPEKTFGDHRVYMKTQEKRSDGIKTEKKSI